MTLLVKLTVAKSAASILARDILGGDGDVHPMSLVNATSSLQIMGKGVTPIAAVPAVVKNLHL